MTVQLCNAGCGRPDRWAGNCSWHHFQTQQHRNSSPQVATAVLTRLRRHIHCLLDAGVAEAQIALDAGLNRKTIQWVSSGRAEAGAPPGYRITSEHATRILAVTVPRILHEGIADAEPVASLGTVRRLRALVAVGHLPAALAASLNLPRDVVDDVLGGARASVSAGTARSAATLFGRLQMTAGASPQARRYATDRGWAPPLAWDEDRLDDATARPDFGSRKRPGFLEVYTEYRSLGFTDLRIAEHMGVQPGSLLRQLIRYGLPATEDLTTAASRSKQRAANIAKKAS